MESNLSLGTEVVIDDESGKKSEIGMPDIATLKTWPVHALKEFLSVRNKSTTGTEEELVARASLEDAENDIDTLEVKLEKLVKLCNSMIEAGKSYNSANRSFINGVHDVALLFRNDSTVNADSDVAGALTKFTNVLNEINNYHSILLDQAQRSVSASLSNFIKKEISKVKETRKHFEKISTDLDNALTKNAQAPKSRPQECEDANNVLMAMRSCFGHTALDYVFQVNVLHSRKRFDILDTLMAFMNAQNTFFHQGSDMFEDLEPFMKEVAGQLSTLTNKAEKERKEMEERHLLVQRQKELEVASATGLPIRRSDIDDHEVRLEGYLFKRTSNAFKSWVRSKDECAKFRRWFIIQKNQLVYRKRSKDSLTVMEYDLRLCITKPLHDTERRFCFEIISPRGTHMLQADSEGSCHAWMSAIQEGVSKAYTHRQSTVDSQPQEENGSAALADGTSSEDSAASTDLQTRTGPTGTATGTAAAKTSGTKPATSGAGTSGISGSSVGEKIRRILTSSGNSECADCRAANPRWASINLGVTLCIACSGVHRSFGVQVSKVRSLTLDDLQQEHVTIMCNLGNDAVNRLYEAKLGDTRRPGPNSGSQQREQFIRSKYIEKKFMDKFNPEDTSHSAKRWTVKKKRRNTDQSDSLSIKSSGSTAKVTSPSVEAEPSIAAEQREQQSDSATPGLSSSSIDGIVFGLWSGDESVSDEDVTWEEMSSYCHDLLLYKAARMANVGAMQMALAQGAQPNWHHSEEEGRTPLIQAIHSGSMTAVEFMLLNGAKVDVKDDRGQSPLHHAAAQSHTGVVCLLLKRGANQNAYDDQHRTPLSIAVDNANADIVTVLRLSKLNEEMQETDGYHAGNDDTFSEVVRDFTNIASKQQDKVSRNK